MNGFKGQIKHVILGMEDHGTVLKALLGSFVSNPMQAYHELLHAMVEAVRWRDKATTEIVRLVLSVGRNLDDRVPCKPQLIAALRNIAQSLQYQAEECELYDDLGVMMYTYHRHPNDFFDDIMLTSIIQLKYNGALYEPSIL